jgi:uncharacterized membrane protein
MTEDQEANQEETPEAPAAEATEAPAAEEPAAPAAEAAEAPAESAGGGDKEVEEGKVFAILSYVLNLVGLPFFLVPLIMRNNEFSLYHAKQCLLIWLAAIVIALVNVIPCLGQIVYLAVCVFLLVLDIIGLVNATKAEAKPIPVIGKWAEDWFKGIKKA